MVTRGRDGISIFCIDQSRATLAPPRKNLNQKCQKKNLGCNLFRLSAAKESFFGGFNWCERRFQLGFVQ